MYHPVLWVLDDLLSQPPNSLMAEDSHVALDFVVPTPSMAPGIQKVNMCLFNGLNEKKT